MKGNSPLAAFLTDYVLRQLASGKSYRRGLDYFESGRVERLSESGGRLTALVRGTELYRVSLWAGKLLEYDCSCPVGADGLFCKHCVAAGLDWLARQEGVPSFDPDKIPDRPGPPGPFELGTYLAGLDRSSLVDIILRQAVHDPGFTERLALRAELSRPGGPDTGLLRRGITDATRPRRPLFGRATTRFAGGVFIALEPVRALVRSGRGADALELARYALVRVLKVMNHADDSDDGCMSDLLAEVLELHLEACRAARPEPRGLARWLFNTAVKSEWDVFRDANRTYADLLGREGLAEYRRLAETAWRRIPALAPGQSQLDQDYLLRLTLTGIMESLAGDDVDELVRVMAKDLSCACRFLDIALKYRKAGREDKALEWAEQGLRAFPEQTDWRLREFLIELYLARGRASEAMSLAWAEFADHPSARDFARLKDYAGQLGQWPTWREEALELLRARAAAERKQPRDRFNPAHNPHAEALVDILLQEEDPDSAWQAARGATLSTDCWLRLAEARAKTHPADAVRVYQVHIAALLDHQCSNSEYEEAVRCLQIIARLMKGPGREAGFRQYLDEFRAQYRRKRNLMRLLDSVRWP